MAFKYLRSPRTGKTVQGPASAGTVVQSKTLYMLCCTVYSVLCADGLYTTSKFCMYGKVYPNHPLFFPYDLKCSFHIHSLIYPSVGRLVCRFVRRSVIIFLKGTFILLSEHIFRIYTYFQFAMIQVFYW